MELREFVTQTLVQILDGVRDAIELRKNAPNSIGAINPRWLGTDEDWAKQTVEFDVALSVSERTSASGEGKVEVFPFLKVGGDLSQETDRSTVSRVRFTIPIIPPAQPVVRK